MAVSAAQTWHNRLPGWIAAEPEYQTLRPAHRHVLQCIANSCDPPDECGHLLGAIGGRRLRGLAGVSARQWWRIIDALIARGYVIITDLGGPDPATGRNRANVYAIPARRGSLDHLHHQDRRARRTACGPAGSAPAPCPADDPRPTTDRPTLRLHRAPQPKLSLPPSDKMTLGGSDMVSLRWCQDGTPPSSYTIPPNEMTMGALRAGRNGRAPGLGRLTEQDLRDTGRLLELYGHAVQLGWVGRSEHDRLMFVGMAEHALRWAHNPPGAFISNLKHERWLMVTNGDEERARQRLASWDHPAPPKSPAARPRPALSADARAYLALRPRLEGSPLRQSGGTLYQIAKLNGLDWPESRWDAARAEAEAWELSR